MKKDVILLQCNGRKSKVSLASDFAEESMSILALQERTHLPTGSTPAPTCPPMPRLQTTMPTSEPTISSACTPVHNDPWSTGFFVECCTCTQERLGDWNLDGGASYRCIEVGCDTPLSICPQTVEVNSQSVWSHIADEGYSCKGAYSIEGSGLCASSSGVPDLTSISVDMRKVADKQGCFAWSTSGCQFDMTNVARIELDAEWTDCGLLWMAPF